MFLRLCFVLTLALPLLFAGCKNKPRPDGLPDLYPCELTVVQEGQPLAGASVSLTNTDQTFPWTIGGITDAQGKLALTTNSRYPGAPLGEFVVVVNKTDYEPGPPAMNIHRIEKEYRDPKTSPLKITIDKSSVNQTLDAGKAVAEKEIDPAAG